MDMTVFGHLHLALAVESLELFFNMLGHVDLLLNGSPLLLYLLQLGQLLVYLNLLLCLQLLLQLYLLRRPASLGTNFEQVRTVALAHAHRRALREDARDVRVEAHQHILLILDLGVTFFDLAVDPLLVGKALGHPGSCTHKRNATAE